MPTASLAPRRFNRAGPRERESRGMYPTVTLLICTSGRAAQLDRCLAAITAGSDLPEQLVVVNGEDAETPGVVERLSAGFRETVLVRHPNCNLATLRNIGTPLCTGDIVAMTDDDAIPARDWVSALRSAHATHPQAGAVGGPVRSASDGFASRVADVVVFPSPRPNRPIYTLPTVNMSYRRTVMEEIGEFDESLFRGEDVDFNWRLLKAGYEIVFEPGMKVQHEHRRSLRGLYQQQWMYGRAYFLVRSKWPEMYSVYPHSLRSARSWAKLSHAGVAIVYQPWGVSRLMSSPSDRLKAYPVLVLHHLVWKLGMARQALLRSRAKNFRIPAQVELEVRRWTAGEPETP